MVKALFEKFFPKQPQQHEVMPLQALWAAQVLVELATMHAQPNAYCVYPHH